MKINIEMEPKTYIWLTQFLEDKKDETKDSISWAEERNEESYKLRNHKQLTMIEAALTDLYGEGAEQEDDV